MSDIYTHVKSRNGALAAFAFASLLTVAIVTFAVSSLFRVAEGDTQSARDQLAASRAEVAVRPSVEASLKQALDRAATSPGLIQAPSAALAQAQLESDVKVIASATGASIRSTYILPVDKSGDYETIAVQYDMSVPMSRLRDLTYAVESHAPYFFIDHVAIQAAQNWQATDTTAPDPQLDVRWTIHGYRWTGMR